MSSSRKRGEKGRSVEREIKRRRVEGRRRPSSDNEAPLRGHEFEADFETGILIKAHHWTSLNYYYAIK